MRLIGLLLATGSACACVTACSAGSEPELLYRVARGELVLERAEWAAISLPGDTLSVLNLSEQALLVTPLGFEGDGADLLDWGTADYSEVLPGAALSIPVTPVGDRLAWRSGSFEVEFQVEVGAAWNDPSDFEVAPVFISDLLRVPVRFELDCDLDRDGDPAAACGGDDCDDAAPDLVPQPGCPDPDDNR